MRDGEDKLARALARLVNLVFIIIVGCLALGVLMGVMKKWPPS